MDCAPLLFQISRFRRLGINRSAPRSRELFQRAWKGVGKVFTVAVALDVIHELSFLAFPTVVSPRVSSQALSRRPAARRAAVAVCGPSYALARVRRPRPGRHASSRSRRHALRLLCFVGHANDRSSRPFLVYGSPFQASSSRPGQSCTATGEFGLVAVGNHVDAGGLLDTPSTSSPAAAAS